MSRLNIEERIGKRISSICGTRGVIVQNKNIKPAYWNRYMSAWDCNGEDWNYPILGVGGTYRSNAEAGPNRLAWVPLEYANVEPESNELGEVAP
jgi:hypothetical protein